MRPKTTSFPITSHESKSLSEEKKINQPIHTLQESPAHLHDQKNRLTRLPLPLPNSIERKAEKDKLTANFATQGRSGFSPIQVIQGMSGVGKSRFASEYANGIAREEPGFVRWLYADTSTLASEWLNMGEQLGLELKNTTEAEQKSLICRALSNCSSWLLVLDNLQNYEELKGLLPEKQTATQRVLITSVAAKIGVQVPVISLTSFSQEQCYIYSEKLLFPHQCEGIDALFKQLNYLPLALSHAIACIQQNNLTANTYLMHYRKVKIQFMGSGSDIEFKNAEIVLISSRLSIEFLKKQDNKAVEIIKTCAYLHPEGIQKNWLKSLFKLDDQTINKCIRAIGDYFLVINYEHSFNMHRLVQRAILLEEEKTLSAEQRFTQRLKPLAKMLKSIYPDFYNKSMADISLIHQMEPHLKAISQALTPLIKPGAGEESPGALKSSLLLALANISSERLGKSVPAKTYCQEAVELAKTAYTAGHPEIAAALTGLGNAERFFGNIKDAKAYYLASLEMRKTAYGENHSDVARSYARLALIHLRNNENKEALEYYKKALYIFQKVHGKEHIDIVDAYSFLGLLYKKLGNNIEALTWGKKALDTQLKIYNEAQPETAAIYIYVLANAYMDLSNTKEAVECYEKALDIYLNIYGEEHFQVARSYRSLALINRTLGDAKEEFRCDQKALDIYLKLYGEEHADVAISYNNLGETHRKLGNTKELLVCQQKALAIYLKVHGEEHFNVAICYSNLGVTHRTQGDSKGALACHQKALAIRLKIYGEAHPNVAISYMDLGYVHQSQKNWKEAIAYHQKALAVWLKDEAHQEKATTCYDFMARMYRELGNAKEALSCYQKALALQLKMYGHTHLKVAESYWAIGITYQDSLGNNSEAKTYLQKALAIYQKLDRQKDIDIVCARLNELGNAPLIQAVKQNNFLEVKKLIGLGADVNVMVNKDEKLTTVTFPAPLLVYTIELGHLEIVDVLLEHKVDIHKADDWSLLAAAHHGYGALTEKLLAAGANINQGQDQGQAFMHYLAAGGLLEIMKRLYQPGQDLNGSLYPSGQTILVSAAQCGHVDTVKFLLEQKADVNHSTNNGFTALYTAAVWGHGFVVKALYEAGAEADSDSNTENETPLFAACRRNFLPVVKYLVDEAKVPIEKGEKVYKTSPLHIACEVGNINIVEFLLQKKADVHYEDLYGRTALIHASEHGRLTVVQVLLKAGAKVDIEAWYDFNKTNLLGTPRTALIAACINGHVEVVDWLLRNKATINHRTKKGLTALCYAVKYNKPLVVARLIKEQDINPSLTSEDTRWMWSPLNEAVDGGYNDIVRLLLTLPNININQEDCYNDFPLYNAAKSNRIEVVRLLLKRSEIEVNMADHNGFTPLTIAQENKHSEIENLLLAHPNIINLEVKMPLIAAAYKGDTSRVETLLKTKKYGTNDRTAHGETALFMACLKGHKTVVACLLKEDKLQVNQQNKMGKSPLIVALAKGFGEIVALLVCDERTDVNIPDRSLGDATPIFTATAVGKIELVRELLKSPKLDINKSRRHQGNDGHNALTIAAMDGKTEIFKLLINDPRIDPNVKAAQWTGAKSALILAASAGYHEILSLLVKHPKTDINITLNNGSTALSKASSQGQAESVHILLGHSKIDVNLTAEKDLTALHCAASSKNLPCLRLLLERPDIKKEMVDIDGNTAIFYSVRQGHLEAAKLFVEYKANIFHKNKAGLTPRFVAIQNGHILVARYLKEAEDHILREEANAQQVILKQEIEEKEKTQSALQTKFYRVLQTPDRQTEDEVDLLRQQLRQMQVEHDGLFQQFHIQQQRLLAEQYLVSEALLKVFYYQLQSKLTELFLAYKVISSEAVSMNYDSKGVSKVTQGIRILGDLISLPGAVTQGIRILGDLIPLPGATTISKAIAGVIDHIAQKQYGKTIKLISSLLRNLTVLDKTAQGVARLVSFQYEEQIMALQDEEQAKILAECAVGRIMGMLADNLIHPDFSISEQITNLLPEYSSKQGLLKLKHQKIMTSTQKTPPWTDHGIFRESGIELPDGRCMAGRESRAEHYGYRLGTQLQAQSLGLAVSVSVSRYKHPLAENFFRLKEEYVPMISSIPRSPYARKSDGQNHTLDMKEVQRPALTPGKTMVIVPVPPVEDRWPLSSSRSSTVATSTSSLLAAFDSSFPPESKQLSPFGELGEWPSQEPAIVEENWWLEYEEESPKEKEVKRLKQKNQIDQEKSKRTLKESKYDYLLTSSPSISSPIHQSSFSGSLEVKKPVGAQELSGQLLSVSISTTNPGEANFRQGVNYYWKGRYAQALPYFQTSFQSKYPPACLYLGWMFEKGQGTAEDVLESKHYYQEARKSMAWFKRQAETGNAENQYHLAWYYKYAAGVEKDDSQAFIWYRKAAEQGYAVAQIYLGACYRDGEGVVKDEKEAVVWFRKAADQGYAYAQHTLGHCYQDGKGVAKNDQQAVVWFRKAADQGDAVVQDHLGDCYFNGRGVVKDEKDAVAWYRKAADQGYAAAQNSLGNCYRDGIGVVKDKQQAIAWYRKAAQQGNDAAQVSLKKLDGSVSVATNSSSTFSGRTGSKQTATVSRAFNFS